MDHDEFIGEVQHRAQLSSRGEAQEATRATLSTLGERIQDGQVENLAAQLPEPLEAPLVEGEQTESFGVGEFVERVGERDASVGEGEDREADAAHHARVVFDVIGEAVTEGQFEDVRAGLPDEYGTLFSLAESEGTPPGRE
ncbi:DUF2267 domain-containing protein [Natronorarus salvus]|uniref:DUF2267 domain-containing protein n=1 Tax=Natronorarus salvus TaxID=3117733 RepID=UPI002F26998E